MCHARGSQVTRTCSPDWEDQVNGNQATVRRPREKEKERDRERKENFLYKKNLYKATPSPTTGVHR